VNLEEIRGSASEDLEQAIAEARKEMFKLRYVAISEAVENSKAIRALRKRIARIHTVLRERALAAASE